jgi:hypothetical protein
MGVDVEMYTIRMGVYVYRPYREIFDYPHERHDYNVSACSIIDAG